MSDKINENTENIQSPGDELFNLLAHFLNRPSNREFLDSIRGEYGVLWALVSSDSSLTAGELKDMLHVVPGRMTDILTALEEKGLIRREKDDRDRRIVNVSITDAGRNEAVMRRERIHKKYKGLFEALSPAETKELMRLLQILLTYSS